MISYNDANRDDRSSMTRNCPKCKQTAKLDKGDLKMDILQHYYCSDCMIWTEDRHTSIWTDGVDEFKSNGRKHHTRLI